MDATPALHLTIGNKLYSSWSLRPWLLLRALEIPFDETVLPLDTPAFRAHVGAMGVAGRVPVLTDGETQVWESLAICEYVADRFPGKSVWPSDPVARAHARSISCEMISGFTGIRGGCPMNLGKRFARRDRGEAVARDVARITTVWREARTRFGAGNGPFLYGAFTAADAMYAPVVTRLDTYDIEVAADTQAYMDAILELDAFRAWKDAALKETWVLDHDEVDEAPVAVYRAVP